MRKVKICIVSLRVLPLFDEQYDREQVIGGAEVNMYNLARYFASCEDVEVMVLADDFGQPPKMLAGGVELIRFGRQSRETDKTSSWLLHRLGRIHQKLCKLVQLLSLDADVFLFTTANPMLGELVLLQRFLRGKSVVFRLSSDLNADLQQFRKIHRLTETQLYRFGLRYASAIVAQTAMQGALLKQKLGLDSTVIENGFFLERTKAAVKKEYVLWVGRCMNSKRPLLFTELAERMPEQRFVMIMPINREIPPADYEERETLAAAVRKKAASLGNLKLTEYVPFAKIQQYFDAALVYVSTSEVEGFPNTFIQAALGRTPILSYRTDPDGMLGRYCLGRCCGDDGEKAAVFIREIAKGALEEYTSHMARFLEANHDIRNAANKYLALVNSLGKASKDASKGGGRVGT